MSKLMNFKTVSVSALAILAASGAQAVGQETGEGEFLGTITLGESKRAVQTDTAVPITVIDKEEIDDRQAGTIAELIDSVPGVTLVNGSTPSGSGINIRGFGANSVFGTDQKVAVFVDGASTGPEELYRIGTQLFTDPYLFKSVEVQRGTVGSFEYGSGIVGGIVRLETIDASDLTNGEPGFKWGQTLGYASNKEGFNTSSTLAWQPTENLEFLANYSYREQDNQDDGDGDEIGNSAFDLPSFLLKGKYAFGANRDHSITASYTQTETSERDVPYDTFFTSTDAFGNVDRDIESQTASLIYEYAPTDNDLINFEAILSYANQEIEQSYIPGTSTCEGGPPFPCGFPFPPGGFGTTNADHQYETTKLTVKNGSFLETGSVEHDLRYGFEVLRRDREDASAAPGGTDDRYAFFIVNNIALTDALSFTPALRYESSEIEAFEGGAFSGDTYDNDAFMGGASLRYAFDSGLALFTSYAYTESLPILDDLGNPQFMEQAETATTFEAGFSFDRIGLFNEGDVLAVKLNYYDTELSDVTSYSGVDEINQEGFELEGSVALSGGSYLDLNANIVSGEETLTSGTVLDWRNVAQDTFRVTLGQRVGEVADFSAEVVSALDDTSTTDIGPGGGFIQTDTDGFTVVNLRATIKPQEGVLKGLEFRFGLENAFDEDYTPLLATRPAPGQNFKVTVSRIFF
ncbi:MAG: TonB-dependent receptor [Pseudomonadota bacterium]